MRDAGQGDRVTIDDILEAIGRRSFGSLMLFAGLVALSPIGDIPGVPTTTAILVFLVCAQLLYGRGRFWLPGWLLRRSVKRKTFEKSLGWVERPARFVDRLLRPRLTVLVEGVAVRVLAATCLVIALAMPMMEFVPFTATGAGVALAAFGMALMAFDGLVALFGIGIVAVTAWAIVSQLLGF